MTHLTPNALTLQDAWFEVLKVAGEDLFVVEHAWLDVLPLFQQLQLLISPLIVLHGRLELKVKEVLVLVKERLPSMQVGVSVGVGVGVGE
tara:strand:+ start:125 stop:394 length:270 start_codon:yes stop_codon:yes gene_type:complete